MQSDHIASAFGRVLREQRETRGISQEDLALSADVDRSFVSQMERGIRQPTLTTLVKLCRALGVAAVDDHRPHGAVARLMHQWPRSAHVP